jgi:DNA-binding winged helix-turn-helix (wHTH) protein
VDVFVRKLRSKLQKRSPGWDYIHTHFGIGYRFDPHPVHADPGEEAVGSSLETPASVEAAEAIEADAASPAGL